MTQNLVLYEEPTITSLITRAVVPGVAAVSVEAGFNDSRCTWGMVCPNDPLLYFCTITSQADEAIVQLPSGQTVFIHSNDTYKIEGDLPDGVTVDSYYKSRWW